MKRIQLEFNKYSLVKAKAISKWQETVKIKNKKQKAKKQLKVIIKL